VPVPRHSVGPASADVSAPAGSRASLPHAGGGAENSGSSSGSDDDLEEDIRHVHPLMVPPVLPSGGEDVDGEESGSSPSASTTDTEISSMSEEDSVNFSSRRKLLCYRYLYRRVRLSTRQYNIMRGVETFFSSAERWPSRWRLQQVRRKLLPAAAPVKKQVTSRQFPSDKGMSPRTLPDVVDPLHNVFRTCEARFRRPFDSRHIST